MLYVLYGKNDYFIKNDINNILAKNNIEDVEISKYDLSETTLIHIINDANSISIFDNKKCIIVNNAYIFTSQTSKKIENQDLTILEDYFNNINENTILIFIINSEKLLEIKKITKLAHKFGIVKEYNNCDIIETIRKMFDNYNISTPTIKLLIDRVGDNIMLLSKEIEKIKIYKNDNYTIADDDIINLTSKAVEENNFKLIDAIVSKNKSLAIKLYEERLNSNEESIPIIIALANNIRIMYQSKSLYMQGHTEHDIASILSIHPYRVKLAIQNSRNYEINDLLKLLNDLADIDYNIKVGIANKEIALELFILNM